MLTNPVWTAESANVLFLLYTLRHLGGMTNVKSHGLIDMSVWVSTDLHVLKELLSEKKGVLTASEKKHVFYFSEEVFFNFFHFEAKKDFFYLHDR